MAYLMDGRLTLSNNVCEREAMKPFVMGRKNWLFANTRKSGDVSCAMYLLAKTAIYNGPDVWAYRKWLLSELPHKKKEGFAYSDCLSLSDKVPDWVREGKKSGKEKRKKGLGHGYYPPPTRFLLYVVIFYTYGHVMKKVISIHFIGRTSSDIGGRNYALEKSHQRCIMSHGYGALVILTAF